jgi:CRISPR-associated endonuclease Cas1
MGYKLADRKKRVRTDYPLDLHNLERIIITPNGKGYLSTYFLDFMKEFNVPIYFVNGRGMIDSCFMPTYHKKPSLIVSQVEARINGKNIQIAKYIITLKLESQGMKQFIPQLKEAKDIKEILYAEAIASKQYFDPWSFPSRFNWTGRHGRSSTNAHAIDPINAILNLGYGLLAQYISEILLERGFELSIGFLHYSENIYWNQLTWDVIEPYRIMIDKEVKNMIDNSIFEPEDFVFLKDRSHLILKDRPFETVLERFLQVLNPLEQKSLPMIRKIEKMLLSSPLDDSKEGKDVR